MLIELEEKHTQNFIIVFVFTFKHMKHEYIRDIKIFLHCIWKRSSSKTNTWFD